MICNEKGFNMVNRKISKSRLDEFSKKDFSFVDGKNREMILINRK